MTQVDLVLQERHDAELKALLARPDGVEAAAYLLMGTSEISADPWTRRSRVRLASHEVIPVPEADAISAGPMHVTWGTDSFVRLVKRAQDEGLVLAIVHTHPQGPAAFSEQDDTNERELHRIVTNRNGLRGRMASLLLAGGDTWRARLWMDRGDPVPAERVMIVGRRLRIQGASSAVAVDEILDRQVRAFGPEATAVLRGLRVGVVGGGGTGSAVAMLLARLGVGQIVLFDNDIVEASNLNRLHGPTRPDADAMLPKVEVIAREVARLGLGVRAVPFRGWIDSPEARDALKSCDVIFGCTDDHDGRLLLDRFARFYAVPVIDVGLAIEASPEGGFRDMSARVTVLLPEAPCLVCRGVVAPQAAAEEALARREPVEHDRRKREAYVRGGGNPAPAVVTFTTEAATMAVNELLQGLTDFRAEGGWAWNRVRRLDRSIERRPGALQRPHCALCGSSADWGRGDVEPFLDRVG